MNNAARSAHFTTDMICWEQVKAVAATMNGDGPVGSEKQMGALERRNW